jgi:hypothetical protein
MAESKDLERAHDVIRMFLDRMDRFGNWDEGCFYYNRYAASELQEPIDKGRAVLAGKKLYSRGKMLREAAEAMLRDSTDHGDLG